MVVFAGPSSWLFAAAVLSTVAAANARPLDYEAEPGCPTESDFVAAVQERARASRIPEEAPFEYGVSVRLARSAAGFAGELTIRRTGGEVWRRRLSDASCTELASALAFVLIAGWRETSDPTSTRDELDPTLAGAASRRVSAPRTNGLRFGFGVELGARTGLTPSLAPLGVAEVELRQRRPGVPSLAVRAGFAHAQARSHRQSLSTTAGNYAGSVDFAWNAGRLELCLLRVALPLVGDAIPCLGGHLGAIVARGAPDAPSGEPGNSTSLWGDVFASLRLEVGITSVAAVALRGELSVPLTHYGFAFDDPDTPVYDTPRLASAGSVGFKLVFP